MVTSRSHLQHQTNHAATVAERLGHGLATAAEERLGHGLATAVVEHEPAVQRESSPVRLSGDMSGDMTGVKGYQERPSVENRRVWR